MADDPTKKLPDDDNQDSGEIQGPPPTMPSSGYNALRQSLDPNDPKYLQKMGFVTALEGQHELNEHAKGTMGAMPDVPANEPAPKKEQAQVPGAPGVEAYMSKDQKKEGVGKQVYAADRPMMGDPYSSPDQYLKRQAYDAQHPYGSDISAKPGTLGKIEHGLAFAGNVAGDVLDPGAMARIPGTDLHKQVLQERAQNVKEKEQAAGIEQEKVEATEQEKEAEIASREEMAKWTNNLRDELGHLEAATKAGDVAAINDSHQKIADMTNQLGRDRLAQAKQEFESTDQFKRWKTKFDNDTKLKVAQMTAGKAPAAMLETANFANGGLDQLNSARLALRDLREQGVLGSWDRNKIENLLFGNGTVDPSLTPSQRREVGTLRAALSYTSSAAMRAHTGRTSKDIYDDFKGLTNPGQDLDALDGALDQTEQMLDLYANAGSNQNMENLRSGNPTGGEVKPPKGSKIIKLQDFLKQH